jgi:molybdate transport system substrate-binding protein
LYLAADSSFANLARDKSLVNDIFQLAAMRPVIVVRKDNSKNITTLMDLLKPGVRLSLGHPDTASIGKLTRDLLEQVGLWDKFKQHVRNYGVFKPTVADVANDVKVGAVDTGVIWDAMLHQYDDLMVVEVPEFEQGESAVTLGVLSFSQHSHLALQFAGFLKSEVGHEFFMREGYRPIKAAKLNHISGSSGSAELF